MDQFFINGESKLEGEVEVLGTKNAILPMMAASILASKGETIINNVPLLEDVKTMSNLLEGLGAKVNHEPATRTLMVDCRSVNNCRASYDLVKKMRASFLLLGPLLARFKKAEISLPGGCAIGARPVNMHLEALRKMGASISNREGYVVASTGGLKGTTYCFDFPTHTGTENIMMAACLAKGTTHLINAACVPEIINLANMLNLMGAKVYGAGTPFITIEGAKDLFGIKCVTMPSRIETAFFMAVGAITGGEIIVKNAITKNLAIVIDKMRQMDIKITELDNNRILVKRKDQMKPVNFTTAPFPGFPTDFQAPMMSLLTLTNGISIVKETIFNNRFMHVSELNRMGANIRTNLSEVTVIGVDHLRGAPVMASDLQGGASLVIAALGAQGKSIIDRIYHIDRGYEQLEERLSKLGASIKRIDAIKKE